MLYQFVCQQSSAQASLQKFTNAKPNSSSSTTLKNMSFLLAVAVAYAGSCSTDSSPTLGTSICHRCGPKKQKKKKPKNKTKQNSYILYPSPPAHRIARCLMNVKKIMERSRETYSLTAAYTAPYLQPQNKLDILYTQMRLHGVNIIFGMRQLLTLDLFNNNSYYLFSAIICQILLKCLKCSYLMVQIFQY